MNWKASIANSLWLGASLTTARRFQCALNHPVEVQDRLLRDQISRQANSAYGRAYRLGEIKNYEDFVQRVPMVKYDDLEPWIQRIRNGEPRVLTSDPVTHLVPTSGSTGARKLIPFTAGLQREFDRAISPWIADLARQHPSIVLGPAYWSITPPSEDVPQEDSKVPIGFADDASYLGGVKRWLVNSAMVAPEQMPFGYNLNLFQFETLFCLLRESELRLISIWHPSFLSLLLDALPSYWDKLLAKISRMNNRRRRELEKCDPKKPESLWPHLRLISCWGDCHARLPMADLQQRFPSVQIQAKGLLATEAVVTIPMKNFHPVALCSHFFEFIDERGKVCRIHELRENAIYEVVVTTAGGLWRYRMHDQVQVTGFLNQTPALSFIGRGGSVSDLFGEKLSEAFVASIVQKALDQSNTKPKFVLLAPEEDSTGWHYTLYLEGNNSPALGEILESLLRQNPHYSNCRKLGQLQPCRVFNIADRGYESFIGRLVSEGQRMGNIKPMTLSRTSGWSGIFTRSETECHETSRKLTALYP